MLKFLEQNLDTFQLEIPFETMFQLELIPYGLTKYQDGKYQCERGADYCNANWIEVRFMSR